MAKTSARAEVLRVLHAVGEPMSATDLHLCLPGIPRRTLQKTCSDLRSLGKIHLYNGGAFSQWRHTFALGPAKEPERKESAQERLERAYRIRTNSHLQEDWRPEPDPVATAWMRNPINHQEQEA